MVVGKGPSIAPLLGGPDVAGNGSPVNKYSYMDLFSLLSIKKAARQANRG
jgi:hypothetical protein